MNKLIENYFELIKEVGKIINYNNLEASSRAFDDCRDAKWEIVNEELILYVDEDEWHYTISSYSCKGEKLYFGEKDDLSFVMAYDENSGWDSARIFILDNKNKI